MRVLLVEDDRKIGQFVKKGLEEVSCTAVWVRSCKEADEALANGAFDVIVLDIGLPDRNGLGSFDRMAPDHAPAYFDPDPERPS